MNSDDSRGPLTKTCIRRLGCLALTLFCLLALLGVIGSRLMEEKMEFESRPFLPSRISGVNSRSARRIERLANAQSPSWSVIAASVSADPQGEFARRVVNCGTTEGNWALLELDRTSIEAALQISVARGVVTSNELSTLRLKAERQLFKQGGRSFVAMHNDSQSRVLFGKEPTLVSQANGNGRLIGMSVGPALGMKAGELGLLIFEDRVVETDASYAVELHWRHPEGYSYHSHHFTFGGGINPLGIIASVYQPTLPPPPSYEKEEVRVRTVTLSGSDMLSFVQFALQIVSFLAKL